MIANILIFLVLIVLTIGAGWLTWRVVRAKRLWVKIAGGLGAGLLTLILTAVSFAGGKGIAILYFPGAKPASDLKVEGTPEQIARGEYLADIGCVGCHGQVDADGKPTEKFPLSGGYNIAEAEGFGFVGQLATENLTPGGKLASYSDGELFRAIRHGVNKDGQSLGFMSLLPFGQMSDDDTKAVVAFLRSQPAVTLSNPTGDNINFVGALLFGAGMFPSPEPKPDSITAPPAGPTADYGKYVATFGECRGCHGPDVTGVEASSLGPAVPNPRPFISTLTAEQFVETMRSGTRPNGVAFPETMPWQNASKMSDDDLAALYAYLTAPVK
ncbi:MAG: c-type cytochrome [Chloroflexi bacterium]|nr:c-type cytochrome [Chloroflexota bacterium]